MRIEILLDVKTTLGEGPLWDVDQRAAILGSILSTAGCFGPPSTGANCGPGMCRRRSAPWRAQGRVGAVVSLQRGFHMLDFKTGEVTLIQDPEPGLDQQPPQRRQGRQAGPLRRRLDGHMEEGPTASLYSCRPTSTSPSSTRASYARTDRAGARTAAPSTSPIPGRPKSGPTTTTSRPAASPTGELRQVEQLLAARPTARRSMPKATSGTRRLRGKLVRYTPDAGRAGHRHAGQEGHERDVRRPEPRQFFS